MLYDIDSFGYVYGYVSKNWNIMSEEDLLADKKLANRFHETRYRIWKRHNITELHELYEKNDQFHKNSFERFCRETFKKI